MLKQQPSGIRSVLIPQIIATISLRISRSMWQCSRCWGQPLRLRSVRDNQQVFERVTWLRSTAHLTTSSTDNGHYIIRSMDESGTALCFRRTTITLLLQRSGSGNKDMKNYRPISKLPFISKLIKNRSSEAYYRRAIRANVGKKCQRSQCQR